jgi:glucose-6-phosphate isomerase
MRFERCGVGFRIDNGKFRLTLPMTPGKRTKKDMRPFVFDDAYLAGMKDPVYLMYRDVGALNPEFKRLEQKYRVRYDLTLMRNGLMGPEYIRTAGHYHPKSYSEIYEVLRGKAAFILQSRDLKKMAVVLAEKGEIVVIPPHYGHQSVNIGKTPLLTGNLSSSGFKSDYSVYEKKRGGAFYLDRCGGPRIMINANYRISRAKFPKIKRMKGKKSIPLDKLFLKKSDKIADFLNGKAESF